MSLVRFDRSPDLQQLRDDGYTVSVEETGYVVVRDVPYVTSDRRVERGVLAYPANAIGDVVGRPHDHVVYFAGEPPCTSRGERYDFASDGRWEVSRDVVATFQLSLKDPAQHIDPDFHVKFTRYIKYLEADAQGIAPDATAALHRPVADDDPDSPFEYLDTATSRAGIFTYAKRLENLRIAIVGLGGTGSYILDQVAKTRVKEIHLFDGDVLLTHNAFRAPGAVSLGELTQQPKKVDYYATRYRAMKRGIYAHAYPLGAHNADELSQMDFVFLSMEGGSTKRQLVDALEGSGKKFIDVSLDVLKMGDGLGGTVQVTASTPDRRDHLRDWVSFDEPTDDGLYSSNIQVADLNGLNAMLAVIKWKKLVGFYADRRQEMHSVYGTEGNLLSNEAEA